MEYNHKYPIKRSSGAKPDELKCAAILEQVYSTDNPSEYASSCHVPAFIEHELSVVLRFMKKRKSGDKSNVCTEMFQYADEDTRALLLGYLNNILSTGQTHILGSCIKKDRQMIRTTGDR